MSNEVDIWKNDEADETKALTGIEKFCNIANLDHTQLVVALKNEMASGNVNPVQAFIAIKRMQKIVEGTLDSAKGDKELRASFLKSVELALDGGKSVDMFGANLRVQDTGVYYDFEPCKDSYLNALYEIQEQCKELIKAREGELKAIFPEGKTTRNLGIQTRLIIQTKMPTLEFSDDEFEENVYPPVRHAGSSIIATFKRK